MYKKIFFILICVSSCKALDAQEKLSKVKFGVGYGIGNELKNSDYTYTNNYYKLQLYYAV